MNERGFEYEPHYENWQKRRDAETQAWNYDLNSILIFCFILIYHSYSINQSISWSLTFTTINFINFLHFSYKPNSSSFKTHTKMHESYMLQNRFGAGMGGYGMAGRFGQNTFDMHSSAQYRQFH